MATKRRKVRKVRKVRKSRRGGSFLFGSKKVQNPFNAQLKKLNSIKNEYTKYTKKMESDDYVKKTPYCTYIR